MKPIDFVGYRFGLEQQLEVVGVSEQRVGPGKSFKYEIICHKCIASDLEQYEGMVYIASKTSIRAGDMPCGCGHNNRKTMYQYEILVKRKCTEKGYVFLGFEAGSGGRAKIKLKCMLDGNVWNSTSIQCFLKNDHGCPSCKTASTVARCTLPEEVHSAKFIASGKYMEGTLFHRLEERSSNGQHKWQFHCPVCYEEGLSDIGQPRGKFTTSLTALIRGCKPCNCPKTGFKKKLPAVLYVMQIVSDTDSFTGFGISNNFKYRLFNHNTNLLQFGYSVSDIEIFHMIGGRALELERLVKSNFEITRKPIEGFKTEATHYHLYDDVIAFVEAKLAESLTTVDKRDSVAVQPNIESDE